MTKLRISEKQYNAILLREQESRLNAFRDTLFEGATLDKALLEEGAKDWILGAAMIIAQALGSNAMAQSGHNKVIADKAVHDKAVMAQIKSTLEDSTKTADLVSAMETLGMKNPTDLLAKNAKAVTDEFNRVSNDNKIGYHLDTRAVTNLQALNTKLAQGYALKGGTETSDTVKHATPSITIKDTLDINFGSDNFFVSGGYELTPEGMDSIKSAIEAVHAQGGKILSVNVESSTDAERMIKFKSETDPTGNIELATLRAKSVIDFVNTMADGAHITHREIPNNGSDVVSTKDFLRSSADKEVTQTLRQKTAQFRYVKLSITAVFESAGATDTPPQIIKHYRYEVVKVIANTGEAKKINSHGSFKQKQFKCNKVKVKDVVTQACETFK